MCTADVVWAADLMARRRAVYEGYSPIFWRRHPDATSNHSLFLRTQIGADDCIALRTDHGFLIGREDGATLVIDDFAVDSDQSWSTDWRQLVIAAWSHRPPATSAVRIVTAVADAPKVSMLTDLELEPVEQWWVKPVSNPRAVEAAEPQPISTDNWSAILASAPPVYDPGGPVLLIQNASPETELSSVEATAQHVGAVLSVFPIPTNDRREQQARDRNWSVASSWYYGIPSQDRGLPITNAGRETP